MENRVILEELEQKIKRQFEIVSCLNDVGDERGAELEEGHLDDMLLKYKKFTGKDYYCD